MIAFYHYTNKSGKDAIVRDKVIIQSNGAKDARFGIGVYGTRLDPSTGRTKIAWNNYDGIDNRNQRMQWKAAWAIRVMIPDHEVNVVDSERDILLYRGDLDLTKYDWEVIKVEN